MFALDRNSYGVQQTNILFHRYNFDKIHKSSKPFLSREALLNSPLGPGRFTALIF